MTGLRIAYSTIPVLGTLFAIYIMSDYEIDEARAADIKQQLDLRNQGINQ
jgi:GPH family glycoside/pentoside/hexuronide:cation symporter